MEMKDACRFRPDLKAWLDGEISGERSAQVERHVAGCAQCREAAAGFREVSRALESAAERVPGPPRLSDILGRVRAAQREEALVVGFLKRLAAVAAAILLVSLAALLWKDDASSAVDPDAGWREDVMDIVLSDLTLEEEH